MSSVVPTYLIGGITRIVLVTRLLLLMILVRKLQTFYRFPAKKEWELEKDSNELERANIPATKTAQPIYHH